MRVAAVLLVVATSVWGVRVYDGIVYSGVVPSDTKWFQMEFPANSSMNNLNATLFPCKGQMTWYVNNSNLHLDRKQLALRKELFVS